MATRQQDVDAARDFFRTLSSEGPTSALYLFYGAESYLVSEALNRVIRAVFPAGRDDLNMATFDGREHDGTEVCSAASVVPMLAPKRVVVVRNAHRFSADSWRQLAEWAEDPAPTTVLVMEAEKVDKRQKSLKALLKLPAVSAVHFPELRERETTQWVARQASRHGLTLARDVPAWLVEAIGTRLSDLDHALERIDLYLGKAEDRRVPLETAMEVVSDTRTRSVFELMDALFARRADAALAQFSRMLLHGESAIRVVALAAGQFRSLLLARDALSRGLSGSALASAAGIPPFRTRDVTAAAQRFSMEELYAIHEEIAAADHLLKSSRLSDRLVVERLFLSICRPGARAS